MYPPHHLGGYELTWRSANAELRRRGHDVRVLTTDFRREDPDGPEEDDVHRELRWYWRDHDFPRAGWLGSRAIERHNRESVERHLREFCPDVVAWWAMGGMTLSVIGLVHEAGVPAVGVVGDDWMAYGPRVDEHLRRRRRRGPDLDAAHWLFNSQRTREASGAPAHSTILHPGVDLDLFQPAEPGEWSWRLLYLGRIDRRKGIDLAIRALPPEATLKIVGGGDDEYLEELRALSPAGRVSFRTCPRDEVPAAYAAADAVVFPVLWEEPWGIVPLEAMAVGRPVVASGRGGSAEYLEHERNALIFDPDAGPEALTAALRRLAESAELRARLREGGFETARHYSEAAYNAAIADALEAALRPGSPRPAPTPTRPPTPRS
jgi:glycosyltransferase involved in cell wall biosynthesis